MEENCSSCFCNSSVKYLKTFIQNFSSMASSWTHLPKLCKPKCQMGLSNYDLQCVHARGMAYLVEKNIPENFLISVNIKTSKGLSAQLTMIKSWYDKCRHLILNCGALITQSWLTGCRAFTLHFVHWKAGPIQGTRWGLLHGWHCGWNESGFNYQVGSTHKTCHPNGTATDTLIGEKRMMPRTKLAKNTPSNSKDDCDQGLHSQNY